MAVDGYIARYPKDVQAILQKIRYIVSGLAEGSEECICYGVPTFKLNGNLVHFAAYKKHIGFYPGPSGLSAFKEEISRYENSKGAVKFPLDRPIPYSLIKKIVMFRIKENMDKK
ncbi:MAG: DUF1801 domain-containing protein [Candidatus Woesearchaeota archaeon]|nr:DUF1801 domain-containing protein [Candidatus Woesearchaeota archaeon]